MSRNSWKTISAKNDYTITCLSYRVIDPQFCGSRSTSQISVPKMYTSRRTSFPTMTIRDPRPRSSTRTTRISGNYVLNPSSAEPLVWPAPLKFISELEPDAKALLEAALMEANREREKRILKGTKNSLPSPSRSDDGATISEVQYTNQVLACKLPLPFAHLIRTVASYTSSRSRTGKVLIDLNQDCPASVIQCWFIIASVAANVP